MAHPSDGAVKQLRLEVSSDYHNLHEVVERTQAFMRRVTDDDELSYRVVLLTSEAVTNAMKHGNSFDPAKKVMIDLKAFSDRIELVVEDEGAGFEPEDVADPRSSEHLLDEGGRGLFLMEQLADEAAWSKRGSLLRLTFHRTL